MEALERDLGVIVNSKVSLEDYINEKVKCAYAFLANMKIAFS